MQITINGSELKLLSNTASQVHALLYLMSNAAKSGVYLPEVEYEYTALAITKLALKLSNGLFNLLPEEGKDE